jgi:spore germination protein YaaH
MSYDSCPGAPCRHATLDSAKDHVTAILKAGVPPEKLLLGIPAYAREMNHPQEVKTYEEIQRLGSEAAGGVALAADADELSIEVTD